MCYTKPINQSERVKNKIESSEGESELGTLINMYLWLVYIFCLQLYLMYIIKLHDSLYLELHDNIIAQSESAIDYWLIW